MAEALVVSASVAGLLSLGIQVCGGLLDFYESHKGADKDVADTLQSIDALSKTLEMARETLEMNWKTISIPKASQDIVEHVNRSIDHVQTGLNDLQKKLEKIRPQTGKDDRISKAKSQLRKSLYPFKAKTLTKLKVICADLCKNLDLVIHTLQLDISAATIKTTETMQQRVAEVQTGIEDLGQQMTEITLWAEGASLWASFEPQASLISEIEDRQTDTFNLKGRQDGLFTELLGHGAFNNWLQSSNHTLWYRGTAGVGKTVFAASVINFLQRTFEHNDVGIAFMYCSYKRDPAMQKPRNVLGALLWQLVRRNCPADIRRKLEKIKSEQKHPSEGEVSEMLKTCAKSFSRAYIIVDALDEYADQDGLRGDFLAALENILPNACFLVTSRPAALIGDQLSGFNPTKLKLRALDEDIKKYISHCIKSSRSIASRLILGSQELYEEVLKEIVTKASGMFLCAQLHMEALLRKSNGRKIKEALYRLPTGREGLDFLYDDALQRIGEQTIDDARLGNEVLLWVSSTLRPLSIKELQHALAVRPDDTHFESDGIEDPDHILAVCGGLVVIDSTSHHVRLIHYTTQEYLDRARAIRFPRSDLNITRTCLMYLKFCNAACEDAAPMQSAEDDTEHGKVHARVRGCSCMYPADELSSAHFLGYAIEYWGSHAKRDPKATKSIAPSVLQMFETSNIIHVSCIIHSFTYPVVLHVSPPDAFWPHPVIQFDRRMLYEFSGSRGRQIGLLAAIEFGLEELCLFLLENGAEPYPLLLSGGGSINFLYEAVLQGDTSIGWLLLKYCTEEAKQVNGPMALIQATQMGYEEFVELFLNSGVNANHPGHDDRLPLTSACSSGNGAIVRRLIEAGADANRAVGDFFTRSSPLLEACKEGHTAIVKELLNTGARVDFEFNKLMALYPPPSIPEPLQDCVDWADMLMFVNRHNFLKNPMASAIERNHIEVVQVLLDAGNDLLTPPAPYPTLAHVASAYCCEKLLTVLIDVGVDLFAPNHRDLSPLHLSGYHETLLHSDDPENTLQILLTHGLDLETRDDGGRTPLHWLAAKQEFPKKALERLLARKPNLNAQDKDGHSALWYTAVREPSNVGLLLAAGANVNLRDNIGEALLHRRASNLTKEDTLGSGLDAVSSLKVGRHLPFETLRNLLEHGADPTLRSENGKTAAEIIQFIFCRSRDCRKKISCRYWHDSETDEMNWVKEQLIELLGEYGKS